MSDAEVTGFDTPPTSVFLGTDLLMQMLAHPALRWIPLPGQRCPNCQLEIEACWTRRPGSTEDRNLGTRFTLSIRCPTCLFRAASQHSMTRYV